MSIPLSPRDWSYPVAYKRPARTRYLWVCGLQAYSTVADRYLPGINIGRDVIVSCQEAMVDGVNVLNVALHKVSDWGDANLVMFNL